MEPEPAEKTKSPEPQRPESERRPYVTPRLTELGKIAQATLADFSTPSDRSLKEGFASVDPGAVLAAVVALPIERWSYMGETVRHLGPMAQDFAAAFGLGADDRHIFPLDATSVALAAIQGLHSLVETQGAGLEILESELTALRGETVALRVELAVREGEPVA